jgi:hypothetical protein
MTGGRCHGDCRLISSVVRDMVNAGDDELAAIQAAVSNLVGRFEARMGGDLVTALCRWGEAAGKHQEQRAARAGVSQLPAKTAKRAS